jgi:hypothetical protein
MHRCCFSSEDLMWRSWEHLDPVADGIAEVQALRTLWAMGDSVLELPDGDILASYRPTSTVLGNV